jgi:hypothetical protein
MGKGATKRGGYKDGSYYGMSRDQFGALSFDEQMKYVERYYKDRGFDGTKNAHWPMHIPPWLGMAIKRAVRHTN